MLYMNYAGYCAKPLTKLALSLLFIFRISHIPVRVQISFLFHVFWIAIMKHHRGLRYQFSMIQDPFINNTTFKTMQLLFLLPSTSV